jgi:hypothetical protein
MYPCLFIWLVQLTPLSRLHPDTLSVPLNKFYLLSQANRPPIPFKIKIRYRYLRTGPSGLNVKTTLWKFSFWEQFELSAQPSAAGSLKTIHAFIHSPIVTECPFCVQYPNAVSRWEDPGTVFHCFSPWKPCRDTWEQSHFLHFLGDTVPHRRLHLAFDRPVLCLQPHGAVDWGPGLWGAHPTPVLLEGALYLRDNLSLVTCLTGMSERI